MAAGGYKEFVAGETLDQDEINDYLMQGVLVFAGTAARGSAIGTPVEGQFSFRTDDDALEFFDGSDWVAVQAAPLTCEYVLISGGAGGGNGSSQSRGGGGGGAGGYFSNVSGENSGGGDSARTALTLAAGTYPVVIGAGGPANTNGSTSEFILSGPIGGGRGGTGGSSGFPGSSGGGGAQSSGNTGGGSGTAGQGFDGGGVTGANSGAGGGGGGAGGIGASAAAFQSTGGAGGAGVSSSITGSAVTRAVGGAGGNSSGGGTQTSGAANTGTGGNGGNGGSGIAGAGGSGVVIFSLPTGTSVTFSGGVTQTSSTVGSNDVYIVTATSTTSETFTIG